jgi:putative ABC transport system substrate-binding protein
MMHRRDFITLLGSAAAWPIAAQAQAIKIAQIGYLGGSSAFEFQSRIDGFRAGLRDLGYVEGTNIVITYRWAEGHYERLPQLAADLVRSKVDAIVASGTPASLAAKRATATIPIVIASSGDPVAGGVVDSVARPGGNVTGQGFFSPEINAKRIELLKELMPQLSRAAILMNRDNPINGPQLAMMEKTAAAVGMKLQLFLVRGPGEFEGAFDQMHTDDFPAVTVDDDGMLGANLEAIATLAARWRLPSVGPKEIARAGGLIGYGADRIATFRAAAFLVDKILKGAKPADIPIVQATKFDFVLNLKTAKTLDVTVPTATLLRADEVIE